MTWTPNAPETQAQRKEGAEAAPTQTASGKLEIVTGCKTILK